MVVANSVTLSKHAGGMLLVSGVDDMGTLQQSAFNYVGVLVNDNRQDILVRRKAKCHKTGK